MPEKWVKKPWGLEVRVRRSAALTYTLLRINPGMSTSLHCHPTKNTSLIRLAGKGLCEFMRTSASLVENSHFSIRNGLFHRIKNQGSGELVLLETENPSEADDIVRLNDYYQREQLGYESITQPIDSSTHWSQIVKGLRTATTGSYPLWSFEFLEPQSLTRKTLREEEDCLYVLDKGGVFEVRRNRLVLRPGDAVTSQTLLTLLEKFPCKSFSRVLRIGFDG